MNENGSSSSSAGIGILGLLQVAFIVLKVIGIINWSWWKVFIPTYISIALFVVGFALLAILAAWENKKDKDRWS